MQFFETYPYQPSLCFGAIFNIFQLKKVLFGKKQKSFRKCEHYFFNQETLLIRFKPFLSQNLVQRLAPKTLHHSLKAFNKVKGFVGLKKLWFISAEGHCSHSISSKCMLVRVGIVADDFRVRLFSKCPKNFRHRKLAF